MSDKKSSESRRKLLKSIAAGGGAVVVGKSLPESWSRPVVDSVMLPAHAQTSPSPSASPPPASGPSGRIFGGGVTNTMIDTNTNNMFAEMGELLTPSAHAGPAISMEGCATENSDGSVTFWFQVLEESCVRIKEYTGTVIPDAGRVDGTTFRDHVCTGDPTSTTTKSELDSINDAEAVIAIDYGKYFVTFGRSGSCPSMVTFDTWCTSC